MYSIFFLYAAGLS